MKSRRGWGWLALGLSFQLVISVVLWSRQHNIPPNFDDSYAYIFSIRKFADTGRFFPTVPYLHPLVHYDYLGYSFVFGFLSRAMEISPDNIYFLSFFVGKLVLIGTIYWWVCREFGRKDAGLTTLLISLFVGTGAIHGWFWVTPSFFAVLAVLWYRTLSTYTNTIRRNAMLLIACLVAVSFHPIGSFGLLIFLSSEMVSVSRSRRVKGLSISLWLIPVLVLVAYWGGRFLTANGFDFGWAETESRLIGQLTALARPADLVSPPRLDMLWSELLSYVFRFPIVLFILPALLKIFGQLAHKTRLALMSTFAGAILCTLIFSEGYRSLLFLWIMLYTFLAVALIRVSGLRRMVVGLFLVSVTVWQILGIWQGRLYNDAVFDRGCVQYLVRSTTAGEEIYFTSQSGINAFAAGGLYTRRLISAKYIRPSLNFYLIAENYEFEGDSDRRFISLEQVKQRHHLVDVKTCGFFEIFKSQSKTD